MSLVIIAAIGKNGELGKNNNLIWNLPSDLKFFKEKTMGKTIIMGRNTFNSLPKLLPGRKHIVLTSKQESLPEEVLVYNNIIDIYNDFNSVNEEVYIIGGALVYDEFIDNAYKMYLTEIDASDSKADAYFPKIDRKDWIINIISVNEENGLKYKHVEYIRRINER